MNLLFHFPLMFLGVMVVVHAYGLGKLGIGCFVSFMAMVKGLMSAMIRFGIFETTIPWLVFLNCYTQYNVYCCNPSFGLATKAKGLQGCGPRGSRESHHMLPGV